MMTNMTDWLPATCAGVALGVLLFVCVRLRMAFAPMARERYGQGARLAVWILSIALMIALANGTLIGLRTYLLDTAHVNATLKYEIWFCALALAVGVFLVSGRVLRRN